MLIDLYAKNTMPKEHKACADRPPCYGLKPTTACLLFDCSQSRQDRLDMQFDSCKQVLIYSFSIPSGRGMKSALKR
jgi:hypothetical protein